MKSTPHFLGFALAALLASGAAHALDFSAGDVTVTGLDDFGFETNSSAGNVLSFDSGATDELFQMFGYIGNTAGGGRVDAGMFTTPGITQTGANTAQAVLTLSAGNALGLAAGALEITYDYTLHDDTSAGDKDWLEWGVSIRNTTGSAIALSFYSYLDFDLDGDFGDDNAQITSPGVMLVTDSGNPGSFFIYRALGITPTHFQVNSWPNLRDALDTMDGSTPAVTLSDNLTPSPFSSADFTGAFQFDLVLGANSTTSFAMMVPEPDTFLLMAFGLAGLAGYGRTRDSDA